MHGWTPSGTPAPSHDWLYFAWERDSNSGSGFIGYEFMQNAAPAACAYDTATEAALIANCNPWANRRSGDFMILWDQQGNSLDLYLRTWTGTAPNLTLSAPTLLNAAVSQAAYGSDGFRGEAAVDLTATIFGGSTACRTFANTIPSTVTGNSDTADYKDTILKTAPPITNCTATNVTTPKVVTDTATDPDTTANVPAGGASIGTGVLAVADSAVIGVTGGTATPAGSVAFYLCKVDSPALCTSGGTSVGSTNLSGAAYPVTVQSPTAYVTSAGRYCWRSVFSGDSANGIGSVTESAADGVLHGQPSRSDPVDDRRRGCEPGIGCHGLRAAGWHRHPAGQPGDQPHRHGGRSRGRHDHFKLYGPSDTGCGTLVYTSPTVTVCGNEHLQQPRHRSSSPRPRATTTGWRCTAATPEHQRHHAQRHMHRYQ